MSAVEIVAPPQMSEKSVDATVLTADAGVQAVVEMTECSVQFSPVMVDQEISAIPGVREASVDARPSFAEVGVMVVPTLLEKSIGTTVVGRAVGSLTNVASTIIETVAPKETQTTQTESTPKESFPIRIVRAYVYFFTFPIRFLLCSAKPVEDEKLPAEETPSSNATSEKSPVASSPTAQPAGERTTNDVETSEKAVGDEPETTVHLARAVPVTAF